MDGEFDFLWKSEDTNPKTFSEQDFRDAVEREMKRPHPSPCGTGDNPHVMHPARYPDGPCINCGWMKPEEG